MTKKGMSYMEEIREVYNREVYDPFVEYCELHNYRTMKDLVRFPFGPLTVTQELPPALLNLSLIHIAAPRGAGPRG